MNKTQVNIKLFQIYKDIKHRIYVNKIDYLLDHRFEKLSWLVLKEPQGQPKPYPGKIKSMPSTRYNIMTLKVNKINMRLW